MRTRTQQAKKWQCNFLKGLCSISKENTLELTLQQDGRPQNSVLETELAYQKTQQPGTESINLSFGDIKISQVATKQETRCIQQNRWMFKMLDRLKNAR